MTEFCRAASPTWEWHRVARCDSLAHPKSPSQNPPESNGWKRRCGPPERTATTSTEAAQLRADEKNKDGKKKTPTRKDKERSAGSSVHSYFTPAPSFHLGGNVCFPPPSHLPHPTSPSPRLRRAGSRRRAISRRWRRRRRC